MQVTDRKKFAAMIATLADLYNKKLSNTVLDIYWLALCKYTLTDLEKAIGNIIVNPDIGQFMPKPADIIRIIDGSMEQIINTAWLKVMYAIKRVGAYDSVSFDDPIIHAAIQDMGGWKTLCRREENIYYSSINNSRNAILNPEDAREALNHKVSAIIVSNHGGRQLDSVISSIDALPIIKNEVGGKVH